MSDIYLAPFIPENPSGFMSWTQGSIYPAPNENTPANNVLYKAQILPGKGQHSLTQADMRQTWIA